MNLARLNHILIPRTKAERDRFRRSPLLRWLGPLAALWNAFSPTGRFLLVVWPLIGAVSLNIRYSQAYVLFSALSALLLAAVLVRRPFRLDGVSLKVHTAPRVTVGQPALFSVTVRNDGQREHQALRLGGPFLPWDGRYLGPPPTIARLPAGESRTVTTCATFAERGEHHLDPFTISALVPLGLTRSALVASRGVRFVVVPRIAPVTRLALPLGRRYQPGGVALASRTGESMELAGVRPYRPGDPIRDLHALSWARVGEPVVREYQQEYFSRVGVVLDTEAAAPDDPRLEAAISLAAGVVAQLSRGEALIDLLVVGHEVHRLTLGRNLGFPAQAFDLLACVKPGRALDPATLERRLQPHLPRLSCVVLVALGWDAARRQLVDSIAAGGAASRVLRVVRRAEAAGADLEPGVTAVTVASVRSGEGLSL